MSTLTTIILSLLSGLVAAIVTLVVTSRQQRATDKYNYKMSVFKDAIAYRADVAGSVSTGNLQKALNQVFVAFNDCPEVIAAFEGFRKTVQYKNGSKIENEKVVNELLDLLKAMARELHINYSFSNDDLFIHPILLGAPQPPISIVVQNTPAQTEQR